MNKKNYKQLIREYSYFVWLIFLVVATILSTYFYDINKKNQIEYLYKSLNNIYLKNSLKKITSELKPRYISREHVVSEGDTYESIIDSFKISNNEKKLFLKTVSKKKNIKVLRPNQKLFFKIDKLNAPKIINFSIEIDKKKKSFF